MTVAHRDVVAIGASAGGVEALRALVAGLPPGFPACVLVVLHVPAGAPSALPAILTRSGPLKATAARDGEEPLPGRIYVAPADHHLLLLEGRLRLSHGPTENGHRPAVDPLFRSIALSHGPRSIGVVLSGARDDGAAGSATIAAHDGVVITQKSDDALYDSMPQAVTAYTTPDHVLAAADMGGLLAELTAMPLPEPSGPDDDRLGDEVAMSDFADITAEKLSSTAAGYGCPSCGGALFELGSGAMPRYRCRVGHAWSAESLVGEQALATEGALWTALRALEEKAALSRRIATGRAGASYSARYGRVADEAEAAIALIRGLIDHVAGQGADVDQHGGVA
jgi:two-component system, chemotaxis family, protein-glutamate methylesterase/glutaminase